MGQATFGLGIDITAESTNSIVISNEVNATTDFYKGMDPITKLRIKRMKNRTTNKHLDARIYSEEIEKLYRQFNFVLDKVKKLEEENETIIFG